VPKEAGGSVKQEIGLLLESVKNKEKKSEPSDLKKYQNIRSAASVRASDPGN
jgi:hypothetical protein